jgi:hypothetical protein
VGGRGRKNETDAKKKQNHMKQKMNDKKKLTKGAQGNKKHLVGKERDEIIKKPK